MDVFSDSFVQNKGFLPLVSVGLPVYNRPEGLRKTLDCLTQQSYRNIEIIIADNASPNPEVEQIARRYAEKDERISYFRHNENKGWGFNTQFVIDRAKGDYFMRATDDDWWDFTFIEKIMAGLLANPKAVAGVSNFEEVDESGNKSWWHLSNHYPLLLPFSQPEIVQNLRAYMAQFEGFGKSNLYFSIFRIEFIRNAYTRHLLETEFLAGDLLINLHVMLKGPWYIHPEVLLKLTFGNEKLYQGNTAVSAPTHLGLLIWDNAYFKSLMQKWKPYFLQCKMLLNSAPISRGQRFRLQWVWYRRWCLFLYDSVVLSARTPVFDIFKGFRRSDCLK
jgi:glycosyltransferase involved in cell wall biosynthesis